MLFETNENIRLRLEFMFASYIFLPKIDYSVYIRWANLKKKKKKQTNQKIKKTNIEKGVEVCVEHARRRPAHDWRASEKQR